MVQYRLLNLMEDLPEPDHVTAFTETLRRPQLRRWPFVLVLVTTGSLPALAVVLGTTLPGIATGTVRRPGFFYLLSW